MKLRILLPILAMGLVPAASGEVTLTFDTDTDGFVEDNPDDDYVVSWSDYNGGTLSIAGPVGWGGSAALLAVADNPELLAELQLALANGGTISYTVFTEPEVNEGVPQWYESTQIANSTGGWDQMVGPNKGLFGVPGGDFPLAGTRSADVTVEIQAGSAFDDTKAQFAADSGFFNIHLGINSGPTAGTFVSGTLYFDDFTITANEEPQEVVIPSVELAPTSPGLNLTTSTGGQYDRQMVRTTDSEPLYSWVGVATAENPVSYSLTIKEHPTNAGLAGFIYLIPGVEAPVYSDPDYQAPNAMRFMFQHDVAGNPAATGSLSYKIGVADSNGPAGNEFWVDSRDPDTGEDLGLGGALTYHGSSTIIGTWTLTFTSDTAYTITAPDGTTASNTMAQSTADAFAGELAVYFGILPGQIANRGFTSVFSNASILGVGDPLEEDFSLPFGEGSARLEPAPANRPGVVILTEETLYWLKWQLLDPGFQPEQSTDLGQAGTWDPIDSTGAIPVSPSTATGDPSLWLPISSFDVLDPDKNFFRLNKPDTVVPEEPVGP